MSSLITIIVPIYNAENYIDKCLNSILDQTYENFEVLLIDDGSTDEGLKKLKKYEKKDKRFKVIQQSNSGPSLARNKGIVEAKGEYLIFIDIDDYINREYLNFLYEQMSLGYDLVTCGYIEISKYGKTEINDFYKNKLEIEKKEFINQIFEGTGGTLWGKIFKKSLIKKYNLELDKDIFMCEDQIFVLEYALKAEKFYVINKNEYNYNRLNENSISKKINFKYHENFIFFIEKLDAILLESIDGNFKNKILEKKIKNIAMDLIISEYQRNGNFRVREKTEKFKLLNQYVKRINIPNHRIIEELKKENYIKIYFKFLFLYNFQKMKEIIKLIKRRC